MTTTGAPQDSTILCALALAMVNHPRASLQELARAVGVSKATLYRLCRTREQLVERLLEYSIATMRGALEQAQLDNGAPHEALQRLAVLFLEHRELAAFLTYYWKDAGAELAESTHMENQLDAFFLHGQQQGTFRIDFSAAALTEIWLSIFVGLADAERRGRVARAGLAVQVNRAFLRGAQADT